MPHAPEPGLEMVCVFITAGPSTKLLAWGRGDIGGHVLRETTSRGLCGLVCPSRTSEGVIPRSSSPTVAGCRLGGSPVGRDRWGGERVVGGVLPRISVGTWGLCDRLCLVLSAGAGTVCVKGGGGAEGECERKRALGVLLCHSLGH